MWWLSLFWYFCLKIIFATDTYNFISFLSGQGFFVYEEGKNQVIESYFETKFNKKFLRRRSNQWKFLSRHGWGYLVWSGSGRYDEIDYDAGSWKGWGLWWYNQWNIKNTGLVAQGLLLELFNNITMGAQLPSEWKEGDIVLILKKPPWTEIGNYRPITLISCVSKLLTKILAKRVSAVLEEEDFVGVEQNCFRTSRSCGDNIFILNSILEFNKSKKLQSHLLFLDLKEVYDRVDRNVLLLKLEQLNFPATFLSFLCNYYFLDSISSVSGGSRTRPQYQKRGLQQGCNLKDVTSVPYFLSFISRSRDFRMKISAAKTDYYQFWQFWCLLWFLLMLWDLG